MFAGINIFWAQMSLRRAQIIFMPKNINSITINITLEGIEKIETEKNDNKVNKTVCTITRAFMHQSISADPIPPRAKPRALAFF